MICVPAALTAAELNTGAVVSMRIALAVATLVDGTVVDVIALPARSTGAVPSVYELTVKAVAFWEAATVYVPVKVVP